MKKHNFSAGPSILAQSVFEKASESVLDFEGSGLSILEISHRSPQFLKVIEQARALALDLAGLTGKGYQALFLHGGASMQFLMVAYNLLNTRAAYADTGTWAKKAYQQAKFVGQADIVSSSADANYTYIPKDIHLDKAYDYLHITTNNTIYGTQYHTIPEVSIPLVADMSSDIFSRVFPYEKFALIYAGAQKNIGPAGTTLVLVREDLLNQINKQIPTLLDYREHTKNESMTNTPTTFAIYTSLLVMQWLKEQGGLEKIQIKNQQKAKLLYDEIERNPLFFSNVNKEDRSLMNVVFSLTDQAYSVPFAKLCQEYNISGITGHRSVGGYRASIYNAMPIESVQLLVDIMKQLESI